MMEPELLIWIDGVAVTIATNTFVNVPVILAYEDVPIIRAFDRVTGGKSLRFDIYNDSGERFAIVKGARVIPVPEGSDPGIQIINDPNRAIAVRGGNELFELNYLGAAAVSVAAELYTPSGSFVKAPMDLALALLGADGLHIGTLTMTNMHFSNLEHGIVIHSDGITIG